VRLADVEDMSGPMSVSAGVLLLDKDGSVFCLNENALIDTKMGRREMR
jgi:hypothetical protein